jgi:hypothetical protein
MRTYPIGTLLLALACAATLVFGRTQWRDRIEASTQGAQQGELTGKVQGGGSPIVGSTVTLFAASNGKPTQLAQAMSGEDGTFMLDVTADKLKGAADKVLYILARGGTTKAVGAKARNDAVALLVVLGLTPPKTVTVNEFTTIASVWTGAQFLDGDVLSGPDLGLRIAAGNVPNFVDLSTGGYGMTIQDALRRTARTTNAKMSNTSIMWGKPRQAVMLCRAISVVSIWTGSKFLWFFLPHRGTWSPAGYNDQPMAHAVLATSCSRRWHNLK